MSTRLITCIILKRVHSHHKYRGHQYALTGCRHSNADILTILIVTNSLQTRQFYRLKTLNVSKRLENI